MNHKKELKIGIFVVTVLVVSFFLINYLRGEDIFNREIELVSSYDNIEGLTASAPVYIKGYKAGKVSEVMYRPETDDFKVICSVPKEFRIPSDSRMTIYSVDIMGGKGVRIDLGLSETLVADGDYLEPAFAGAKAYDSFQFVRQGFFCVDSKDSAPDALVFNRIVSLKSSYTLPK